MTEEPKRMTAKDWMAMEVSEEHATSVANMTDEKLMTAYLVNGMLAAVAGEGSLFRRFHAAVVQEISRRGLKMEGMLS